MYVHPKFAVDRDEALALAARIGFGLFVAQGEEGPLAAHLPFLFTSRAGGDIRVAFHVARNNALANLADGERPFLLAVTGPDVYISPDWYVSENQVSTWLYEAVHLTGPARPLAAEAYLDHVDALSAVFEQRLWPKKPWTSDKMDAGRRDAMLKGIVAMEMTVQKVEGQRKLNQHKGDADHVAIVEALDQGSDPKGHAIADMMRMLRPELDYDGDRT